MKKYHAFALLEVLLAVILIAIVTAGSYALVKSMSSNSGMQKLTRYAVNIVENYKPFLDSSVSVNILSGTKLSKEFLTSIYIPEDDLTDCGSSGYCWVNSGFLYQGDSTAKPIKMTFDVIDNSATTSNFFVIGFDHPVTSEQKNQLLQSFSTIFSIYCTDTWRLCTLDKTEGKFFYIQMVFPKAGGNIPDEIH